MIFSYLLEGKRYSTKIIGTVLLMLASVLLTTFGAVVGTRGHFGDDWIRPVLIMCLYSLISTAIRPVVAARLMNIGSITPMIWPERPFHFRPWQISGTLFHVCPGKFH